MSQLDKTGPMGQGAQTGRKMGRCNTDTESEKSGFFPRHRVAARIAKDNSRNGTGDGRGLGKGPGRARGWNKGRNE